MSLYDIRGLQVVKSESGFSLTELVATMAMMAIIMALMVPNWRVLDDPLQNSTEQTIGFLKKVKARAVSTTSAYVVEANGPFQITTSFANACSDPSGDFQSDNQLELEMDRGVEMSDTSWNVCFSSRGLADQNIIVPLRDQDGDTRAVEVFLGGAVREQ